MEILTENNNLILKEVNDFDLRHIFDCGQCFRFDRTGNDTYTGVAHSKVLTVSQKDDSVIFYDTSLKDFNDIWYDYFDLGRDYSLIKSALSSDSIMRRAILYGGGIRILKQELWETVVSFIISASNNIPRIKRIIDLFCRNFGKKISYMGKAYYSFPSAETTAGLSLEDLSVIKAGFRDKYILDAAKRFASGEISESRLYGLSASEAKSVLMTVSGIGSKVADCILLFGLQKTGSFPVDVWIKRIMEYCYLDGKDVPKKEIAHLAAEKFGTLGGYAQQYLFFYARENKIGTG